MRREGGGRVRRQPTSQDDGSVRCLRLFVTEGEEDYLGGKTAEPSIASSKATGSNNLIVMPAPNHRSGIIDIGQIVYLTGDASNLCS